MKNHDVGAVLRGTDLQSGGLRGRKDCGRERDRDLQGGATSGSFGNWVVTGTWPQVTLGECLCAEVYYGKVIPAFHREE